MSEPPSQDLMAIDSIVSRKIWCRRQNLISYQQYQQSVDRNAMQPQDIFWLKWESNRKKLKVGQNKWQTQRISWGYYIFDLANRCSVCNIPSFLFFNLFFFFKIANPVGRWGAGPPVQRAAAEPAEQTWASDGRQTHTVMEDNRADLQTRCKLTAQRQKST